MIANRAAATGIVILTLGWMSALVMGQGRTLRPGDPLPGLTAREFSEFRLGLDDFTEVETSEEGLGPAFNGTSCAVCHNVPAIGGTSTILETRAATVDEEGGFRALDESGETLMHLFSIPTHGCQPMIPATATIISRRAAIPLFGAGLVEAIGDNVIFARADPDDVNGDGISGRAAVVVDPATGAHRIGRFGWKAQHATLLTFGADAYRNEMGITNDLFPQESGFGLVPDALRLCDPMPEPEDRREPLTGRRGIDNFESFMKFLAPIARGTVGAQETHGEAVFNAVGCAACHVPQLITAPNHHPLFDRKSVPLFSDLLLHDIGTGDGIRQADAGPTEFRTPALWGLRLRRPFLHDGSAPTIEAAIRRHGGEALLARQGFEKLNEVEFAALIAFLRSL
jgi:CxxC motif-containing protein (DUF1111 family)